MSLCDFSRATPADATSSQRGEWTKALLKTSNQSTLSFFLAAPPPPQQQSPASAGMERKPSLGSVGVGYDSKGNKLSQSRVVAAQALKIIGASLRDLPSPGPSLPLTPRDDPSTAGPVIRLSPALLTLFNRLSLVYHRTSYTAGTSPSSASPLTASLLARFGKRAYPSYVVARSFALFPSRATLREFEAAMGVEAAVEAALDGVWGPGVAKRAEKETKEERMGRYGEGVAVWEGIEEEWRRLCGEAEEGARRVKEEEEEAAGEQKEKGHKGAHGRLYYRRRFHPGWPLSRAAYKAAACYAKLVRPRPFSSSSSSSPRTPGPALTEPNNRPAGRPRLGGRHPAAPPRADVVPAGQARRLVRPARARPHEVPARRRGPPWRRGQGHEARAQRAVAAGEEGGGAQGL